MEIGTRIRYWDTDYPALGTILRARIDGQGEDAEAEYLIRWDNDPDQEGPTWSWWMEIVPV
ncbi:hypothetical protein ACIBK9_47305 [Nonomuraea sp. NPDC050227]|uniref:hypothetical protein n=1 Tax=Nonomuraea sp. NPDC050227 TaxID=3364360 RepID=UPI00379F8E34